MTGKGAEPGGLLAAWVGEWTALLTPDRVHWCDGSRAEYDALTSGMVEQGTLLRLNEAKRWPAA